MQLELKAHLIHTHIFVLICTLVRNGKNDFVEFCEILFGVKPCDLLEFLPKIFF